MIKHDKYLMKQEARINQFKSSLDIFRQQIKSHRMEKTTKVKVEDALYNEDFTSIQKI